MHFISKSAGGPCSMCGGVSTHKVGEEIPHDEPCRNCGKTSDPDGTCGGQYHMFIGGPLNQRHNLTAYVCCKCFTLILGPATGCPAITTDPMMMTATFDNKEWILLQHVLVSENGATAGHFAVECHPNGATKLPAVVHYIEIPTRSSRGNDAG